VISSGRRPGRPSPGGGQQLLRMLRSHPAVVALLLAVVCVSVGVSGRPLTERGPWHNFGGPVAAALELVLAALMLTLRSIRQRERDPGYLVARVRLFLHRTILGAMLVVAWVVVSTLVWPGLRKFDASPMSAMPWVGSGIPPTPFRQYTRAEAELIIAGITLLVLAIIAAGVFLVRRISARAKPVERIAEQDQSLRQAVDSGLRALHSVGGARAAIIACYLSMEESLSAAGTARSRAETPAELLHRAVSAGLLHGPAASQLIQLFYEARYSSHELPAQARKDALGALGTISADLETGAHVSPQPGSVAAARAADA